MRYQPERALKLNTILNISYTILSLVEMRYQPERALKPSFPQFHVICNFLRRNEISAREGIETDGMP